MENENPYTHIWEFEEVCTTFKEGATDMDLLKLKAFPLTLKDKAKIWLNSLRPRTIRNWAELQAEFSKKFFSADRTNNLKRHIYTFAAHDNEKFYQCWERYMETINACPHHGFDTWMLVNHFYDGMSSTMKQLLETMYGGDFLSKNLDEAIDFLNYVVETSKAWDEPNPRETDRMRPPPNQRGGMYSPSEDIEMKSKLSTFARRLEELEMRNQHEVRAVTEASMPYQPWFNCQSTEHQGEHCQSVPSVRDFVTEQANTVGQYKPPATTPYSNTYNPNWRNHPNLSWKPKPPPYVPPATQQQHGCSVQPHPPPSSSPNEQAVMNLTKVVCNFVEEQKAVNAQANQRIDTVESTLDKKMSNLHSEISQKHDSLQAEISQKYDNLQYSISRLFNQQQMHEKGKFPSHTQPNPRRLHEVSSSSETNYRMDEVKEIITLRSGKELKQPTPKVVEQGQEAIETEPEEVVVKQTAVKNSTPPPFP